MNSADSCLHSRSPRDKRSFVEVVESTSNLMRTSLAVPIGHDAGKVQRSSTVNAKVSIQKQFLMNHKHKDHNERFPPECPALATGWPGLSKKDWKNQLNQLPESHCD